MELFLKAEIIEDTASIFNEEEVVNDENDDLFILSV